MARLADPWARLSRARVAVLATNGAGGHPHLVPCCFAIDRGAAYTAVDDKPKTSLRLRRLDNIAADPRVALLVDHYDDDNWEELWWINVTGTARIVAAGFEHDRGVALLLAKYGQYAAHSLDGPIIVVTLAAWRSWAFH
jgi:PPOX class probable F420-dependent enzyme